MNNKQLSNTFFLVRASRYYAPCFPESRSHRLLDSSFLFYFYPDLITQSIVFVYQGWHALRFQRKQPLRRSSEDRLRRRRKPPVIAPIRSPAPRQPLKRIRPLRNRIPTGFTIPTTTAISLSHLLIFPKLLTAPWSVTHPTALTSARTAHSSVLLPTALRSVLLDNHLDPQCAALQLLHNSLMKI